VPIGAVVADANEVILSRGRNRINDSESEGEYLHGHTLAHAEINALITLGVSGEERHECELYTTVEPCPLCMGAFYMSGVRVLRYASREPYGGSVNLLGKTPYLSSKPVKVIGPERNDFEIINISLSVEYILMFAGKGLNKVVLEAWASKVPQGVALGYQLYQTGELQRRKIIGGTAQEALAFLEGLL
jgi:tRNA(Arg) A34 adenosine deaminase TadA